MLGVQDESVLIVVVIRTSCNTNTKCHVEAQRKPGKAFPYVPEEPWPCCANSGAFTWCSHQESNLDFRLRRLASYPLNDESVSVS